MSSLNEVILQVQTQLQEDWVAEQPVPVIGAGTGLAVTVDNDAIVQCYYVAQDTVFNAYQRPLADGNSSPGWLVEDTHFPSPVKPKSIRAIYVEGFVGDLCVACASDGNIYVLKTAARYPVWEKIINSPSVSVIDAIPVVTLSGEPRIAVNASVNEVYLVNLTTHSWTRDRNVESVTSGIRDLKVDRAYASSNNKSTFGYLLSGDGVTTGNKSGIVTVTAQTQPALRRIVSEGSFSSLAHVPLTTTNATPLIFAIDNKTQLASYFRDTGNGSFTAVPVFNTTKVRSIDACLRSGLRPNGVQTEWVEVFAVDLEGNLLHVESVPDPLPVANTVADADMSIYPLPNGEFAVRKWGDHVALAPSTAGFGLSAAGDGYSFLVALSTDLGSSSPSLIHYTQDPATTEWESDRVEIPVGAVGAATKKSVYYVEVSVFDTNNVRMPYMTAVINSNQLCTINVNGVSTTIDEIRSFSTVTNATGKISFTIDAQDTLAAPTFTVWVEGMAQDHVTDVQGSGDIQAKFRSITADQLKNDAIDQVDKKPLFSNLSKEVLEAMATSLNTVMEVLDPQTEITVPEGISPQERKNLGALPRRYIHHGTAAHLARTRRRLDRSLGHIRGNSNRGFHVALRPKLAVTRMTASHAQKMIDQKKALGGSFLNISWGDLWRGVKNGIITVVNVTMAAIEDGVNALINLVKDGVSYLWDGITSFVRQAFDVVGGIFDAVGVFFQKIFNWLCYILNWADIKHTAQVFEGMFTTFTNNGQNFFGTVLPSISQEFFDRAKGWLTQNFDAAERLTSTFMVGTYDKDGAPSQGFGLSGEGQGLLDSLPSTATWLLNKFLNTDGGSSDAMQITGLSDFLDAWTAFSSELDLSNASADLRAALDDLSIFFAGFSSRSSADKSPISAILSACKNILFLIIDSFQLLIKGFGIMASLVIKLVDQFLSATLDIPVLSAIFEAITGEKLVVKKVITTLIAIPFTIAYKLISGEAPFKTVATNEHGLMDLSKTPADDINLTRGILDCLYTLPDLYLDFVGANVPATVTNFIGRAHRWRGNSNGRKIFINGLVMFFPIAQLALSSYPPPSGRLQLAWGLQATNVAVNFGWFMASGFVKGPRGNTAGSITLTVMALAQLGPAIWHAVEPEDNSGKTNAIIVSEFLAPLSGMAKFLAIWKNPYTYAALFVCDSVSGIGSGTARITAYGLATDAGGVLKMTDSNESQMRREKRVEF